MDAAETFRYLLTNRTIPDTGISVYEFVFKTTCSTSVDRHIVYADVPTITSFCRTFLTMVRLIWGY